MSDGELILGVICGLLAAVAWVGWFFRVLAVQTFGRPRSSGMMTSGPFVCGALLLGILLTLSADDVRTDARYLAMYQCFGAAWVAVGLRFLPLVGVDAVADVLERSNKAAGSATFGGMLGLTLCFAGANIGNGPGWWVVAFTAGLATLAFFGFWMLLNLATSITDLVTIDRDRAAGVRLFGLLLAAGLVMGRGAAGDWHGYDGAAADFVRVSWPVSILLLVEAVLTMLLRPRPEQPSPSILTAGAAPAVIYTGAAAGYVSMLGWPA